MNVTRLAILLFVLLGINISETAKPKVSYIVKQSFHK